MINIEDAVFVNSSIVLRLLLITDTHINFLIHSHYEKNSHLL
jgi:hypothetical protein